MQINTSNPKPAKIRRTRSQWQTIIETFEQSGLSVQAFCQQHDLAYSSFAKWRSLLKQQPAADAVSFIELPDPSIAMSHSPWRIELDLGAGVTLRLTR